MRKHVNRRIVDALLPGARRDVLAATLLEPGRWWYLSDLARRLGRAPSSLQRELASLSEAGILRQRRDGNRVYFQADQACPVFAELAGLMAKTAGLVDVLREALAPLRSRIRVAFVHGSVARGTERSSSDVDLLLVGTVSLAKVAPALRRAEARLGRPVNVTLYSPRELGTKLAAGHHFLRSVLGAERLFVIGHESDLEAIAGAGKGRASRDQRA
jgi:predicted nucleotidyltransferase